MNIQKFGYESSWSAVLGFWSGFLGGTAIIAGGKLWTLMTDSSVKVSTLLGHIGTPNFRRQLAVGLAVSCVSFKIFEYIHIKKQIDFESLSGKIYNIIATAVAVALGSFAASKVTHAGYRIVLYSTCALSAILLISDFYQRFSHR